MYKGNVKTIRKKTKSLSDWGKQAERELKKIIQTASALPAVRRLGPKPSSKWTASVTVIGASAMTQLNVTYRGKDRPTDVLSFVSPDIFWKQGHLGELVICLPVLKRQARELKHKPELELQILLIHGLLHLLGLDHELSRRQAAIQGRFEQDILDKLLRKRPAGRQEPPAMIGLIRRAE
jgi:rRNA maturation RNase YbeY